MTWALAAQLIPSEPGDLDSTDELLSTFRQVLSERNITICALSGSWGPGFASLVFPELLEIPGDALILASETIYSPASIRTFTGTLLDLIQRSEKAGGKTRALVAAKKVYFGVGGGVDEFLGVLRESGKGGKVVRSTEGTGSGVGRCILEVIERAS